LRSTTCERREPVGSWVAPIAPFDFEILKAGFDFRDHTVAQPPRRPASTI
jgi:hypothetical protein